MSKLTHLMAFMLFCTVCSGQSSATLTTNAGVASNDLQKILYFEGINLQTFAISSPNLKGKDYQLVIKEFKNGNRVKSDTAFNSREDEYFRLKGDSLFFTVLTKMSDNSYFKIDFQFNGFSVSRKYSVLPANRDKFTLKSFYSPKPAQPIEINRSNYLLAYMMPYVRKDKSEAYCEVAQSGINPEKLYDTYKIPHYFLIELIIK